MKKTEEKPEKMTSEREENKNFVEKNETMEYAKTIDKLKKAVDDINSTGIQVAPLNKLIEDLESHSENIEKIEKNIDAVRVEIISPIKEELNQNKRAGKFSMWGFYFGGIGLLVTIVGILFTVGFPRFQTKSNLDLKKVINKDSLTEKQLKKLDTIVDIINELYKNYNPVQNDFFIRDKDKCAILKCEKDNFYVNVFITKQQYYDYRWLNYDAVTLCFFINDIKIGNMLTSFVEIIDKKIYGIKDSYSLPNYYSYYNPKEGTIVLAANDEFILYNKFRFKIKYINTADKEESIILELIKNTEKIKNTKKYSDNEEYLDNEE